MRRAVSGGTEQESVGLRERIDPRPERLERLHCHRRADALGGVDKPAEPAEGSLGPSQRLPRRGGAEDNVVHWQVLDYAEAARARHHIWDFFHPLNILNNCYPK